MAFEINCPNEVPKVSPRKKGRLPYTIFAGSNSSNTRVVKRDKKIREKVLGPNNVIVAENRDGGFDLAENMLSIPYHNYGYTQADYTNSDISHMIIAPSFYLKDPNAEHR